MEDVFITLDIDWAPDPAIDASARLLEEAGCRATWFVTHRTSELDRLRKSELFELGIHPNFLPGSSHGSDPDEVLRCSLSLAPEARYVRTHSAMQSGPILKALREQPQLELDCSVMLPGLPHAKAVPYGDGVDVLWRVPNWWSDDYEAAMQAPEWSLEERLSVPGVKILIFHPIHIALNTARLADYEQLKRQASEGNGWSSALLGSVRRPGDGAATALREVAASLGRAGGGSPLSTLITEPAKRPWL